MAKLGRNYHREVIALLEKPASLNKEGMLWWIAKAHPSVFVWAAKMTAFKDVEKEIRDLVKSGNLLAAIKRHRELVPGTGLKESKDYIDGIAEVLRREGVL